jgi:hypothetical protein
VEDPVEPSAEDEDHVSFFEGGRASGGDAEGVGVGEETLAHWGWEEGNGEKGEEFGEGGFGFGELSTRRCRRKERDRE